MPCYPLRGTHSLLLTKILEAKSIACSPIFLGCFRKISLYKWRAINEYGLKARTTNTEIRMPFELPALPWEKNALEPHITSETLDYHYGKHHNAYVTNLN